MTSDAQWYALRLVALAMVAAALSLVLLITAALAHSWYEPDCCSSEDCYPVPAEDMIETEKGWKHLPTGTEYTGQMVRPSRDRHFHICIGKSGMPYCAYILQGT